LTPAHIAFACSQGSGYVPFKKGGPMKLVVFIFTSLLVVSNSFAEEHNPILEKNMGQMGDHFKELGKSLSIPAKNAASIERTKAIEDLVYASIPLTPVTVAHAPAKDQRALQLKFSGMLSQLLGLTFELETALLKNDNKAAMLVAEKMVAVRKLGHELFKPQQ
jgi:hypothetical protein